MASPWMMFSSPLLQARLEPLAFQVCSLVYSHAHRDGRCLLSVSEISAQLVQPRSTVWDSVTYLLRRRILRVEVKTTRRYYVPLPPTRWRADPGESVAHSNGPDTASAPADAASAPADAASAGADVSYKRYKEKEKNARGRAIPAVRTTSTGARLAAVPAAGPEEVREAEQRQIPPEALALLHAVYAKLASQHPHPNLPADFDAPPAHLSDHGAEP